MTLSVFQGGISFNDDGTDKDINAILSPNMMESETTAPNDPTGTKLGVAVGPSALDPGPVTQQGPSKRKARRAVQQPLHEHLVVSNIAAHSAKKLCESHTSAGPDFVSTIESLFCDMSEKILWPLCDSKTVDSCFDLEAKELRMAGVNSHFKTELRARSDTVTAKSYQQVQHWE